MTRLITVICDWRGCQEKALVAPVKGGVFYPYAFLGKRSKKALRRAWSRLRSIGWGAFDDGDGWESVDYCPKHAEGYLEELRNAPDPVPEYR